MKLLKYTLAVSLAALLIAACDDGYNDSKPTLKEPALLSLKVADLSDTLVLLEPKAKTVDLRIAADSISDSPLKITMAVAPEMVDVYNKAHGTDYEIVPGEAYTIPADPTVILPRYNKISSTVEVTFKSSGLSDTKTHILPVTILSVSGTDKYSLSSNGKTVYLFFRKRVLPPMVNIDRKGWTILYCSSERLETNKDIQTGLSKDLLDGDPRTYWNYDYKAPEAVRYVPFYIVFDMGKEVTVRGISMLARRSDINDPASLPKNPPCNMTIELATTLTQADGMKASDYTASETFGPADLPFQYEQQVFMSKINRARYVRFTYAMGYNGSASKPTYKGGCLAEFYVLGNYEVLDLN